MYHVSSVVSNMYCKFLMECIKKTKSLGISEDQTMLSPTNGINDPVEKAIKKYANHPSIKKIKETSDY